MTQTKEKLYYKMKEKMCTIQIFREIKFVLNLKFCNSY